VFTDAISAVHRGPTTNVKIEEINGSQISKRAPNENGPQLGEIQQPKRAQYLTHLPLSAYSRFPVELTSILLLAFPLFASVAAISEYFVVLKCEDMCISDKIY
jgi:hypothetical protein